jgi:hypothetical protein
MTTAQKTIGVATLALAGLSAVLLTQSPPDPPPPAWPVLKATWNPVECHGYNFYHGTNLDRRTWVKIGSTTTNVLDFQSEEFGFIGLKAFNRSGTNELESDWATP